MHWYEVKFINRMLFKLLMRNIENKEAIDLL